MKRSLSLDILKLILSFFIILSHLQPLFSYDSLEGWLIGAGLSRAAVPCFFIITGFFLGSKILDKKTVLKYLGQLLIVYVFWSIFYFFFYYEGTSLSTILGRFVFGYFHLWYLPALFSGIIFLILALKFIKNDYFIIALILLIYLIGHVLDPTRTMAHFFRNGLFIGFPFVAFGYYIRKYDLKEILSSSQLITIMVFSSLTLLLETYLYYYDGMKFSDMYLSALLFCPATILLCLKNPYKVDNSIKVAYFSDLSSGIYFCHVFFIFKMYSFDYNIFTAPLIFAIAALTSIVLIYINRRLPVRVFL